MNMNRRRLLAAACASLAAPTALSVESAPTFAPVNHTSRPFALQARPSRLAPRHQSELAELPELERELSATVASTWWISSRTALMPMSAPACSKKLARPFVSLSANCRAAKSK